MLVVVLLLAWRSLVAGCRASSGRSAYVLFLDDDVELHPRCLEQLVDVMQRDRTLFMATGECGDGWQWVAHAHALTCCSAGMGAGR